MAYLGLVPSEQSSGERRRQGGITKAGNGAARRMLIEAAWSYRFPARVSRARLLRQEGLEGDPRGTHSCGSVAAIASWPIPASPRPWSPPPLPASWPALSGPLPVRRTPVDQAGDSNEGGARDGLIRSATGQGWGRGHGRGTLASTNSRITPMLVPRPRPLRDASGPAGSIRASEDDQPSSQGRASCFARSPLRRDACSASHRTPLPAA